MKKQEKTETAKKRRKGIFYSYAWSTPSLLLIALMVVFPIVYTGYISLTNMNVYHWFDFTIVGLDNYLRALFVFDSGFLSALLATIVWTVVNMVLQSIGTTAVMACRACGCETVVLTGFMSSLPQARSCCDLFTRLHGVDFIIPDNATHATSIGAALSI